MRAYSSPFVKLALALNKQGYNDLWKFLLGNLYHKQVGALCLMQILSLMALSTIC